VRVQIPPGALLIMRWLSHTLSTMTRQSLYLLIIALVLNAGIAVASGFLVSHYLDKKRAAEAELENVREQVAALEASIDRIGVRAEALSIEQRQLSAAFWLRRCGADRESPLIALPQPTHPSQTLSRTKVMRGMGGK
jgi:hypothetical protein